MMGKKYFIEALNHDNRCIPCTCRSLQAIYKPDKHGQNVEEAQVDIEATMNHAGMIPIFTSATHIKEAHYSFHFFTGLFAFVPLLFKIQIPNSWMGLPTHMVTPIQYGFLLLGFLGSLSLVWMRSNEERSARLKWSATHLILFFLSLWIMSLPMEMRGTLIGIAP